MRELVQKVSLFDLSLSGNASVVDLEPKPLTFGQQIILSIVATLILAISGQFSIPLLPVPISLQDATVVLLAFLLPGRVAIAAVTSYLTLGAMGAPVFADFGAGFAKLLGPTGGYLLGFWAATCGIVWIKSKVSASQQTMLHHYIAVSVAAFALILACGYAQLSALIGPHAAYVFGVEPFYLVGLAKLLVVSLVAFSMSRHHQLWQ